MPDWSQLVSDKSIQKTVAALAVNGIQAIVVDTGERAKAKTLEMLPPGVEVMAMSSVTLETTGITAAVNQSGNFASVKSKLTTMDRATQEREMQQLGAAPEYAIGSVHAVTESGQVVIASNTGSQLPAYVYGAGHVIWVAGAQKIVPDLDTAFRRIYDYILPLESDRVQKAYGLPGSNVSKILIINKEVRPSRLTLILVKQQLGF